jgi:hypothetical protein
MVPAAKFPEEFRATTVEAVFSAVASMPRVSVFVTPFPVVLRCVPPRRFRVSLGFEAMQAVPESGWTVRKEFEELPPEHVTVPPVI